MILIAFLRDCCFDCCLCTDLVWSFVSVTCVGVCVYVLVCFLVGLCLVSVDWIVTIAVWFCAVCLWLVSCGWLLLLGFVGVRILCLLFGDDCGVLCICFAVAFECLWCLMWLRLVLYWPVVLRSVCAFVLCLPVLLSCFALGLVPMFGCLVCDCCWCVVC